MEFFLSMSFYIVLRKSPVTSEKSPRRTPANTSVTDAAFTLLCVTVDKIRGFPFSS